MVMTNPTPEDIRRGLEAGLKRSGIESDVSYESIPATSLHRFVALSRAFDAMPYSDRQSLVWRITDTLVPSIPDQLKLISSIVTLGAVEIGENGAAEDH